MIKKNIKKNMESFDEFHLTKEANQSVCGNKAADRSKKSVLAFRFGVLGFVAASVKKKLSQKHWRPAVCSCVNIRAQREERRTSMT
jgi:hypothetical protein